MVRLACAASIVAGLLGTTALAQAQTVRPASADTVTTQTGEIIVTARKRAETSIEVPVQLQAFAGADLERRAIASIDSVARVTPLLMVGESSGSLQGGAISMRGIAGPDTNPFGDQAVSFNIDGVQVARSTVRRLAQMDIGVVEVLKGSQALFFGKNSPGGVISIRSADPGSSLDAKLSAGYEFNAHEWRGDGFISGPLSDTVGARLAFYGSTMRGWVKNNAPVSSGIPRSYDWAPNAKEFAARLTLKFQPSDRFDARIKLSYNTASDTGQTGAAQMVFCPLGVPQVATTAMDCKVDNNTSVAPAGPLYGQMFPDFHGGALFGERMQFLPSLEMNYKLTDNLTLTSLSSMYLYHSKSLGNFVPTDIATRVVMSGEIFKLNDLTQEVRLLSSFDGPLNFLVGAFYQDSWAYYDKKSYRDSTNPVVNAGGRILGNQNGESWSLLGQLILRPITGIELAAGGRYSRERKRLSVTTAAGVPIAVPNPRTSFRDFSPEVNLSWHPTPDWNIYATYKEGFLSGGYNAASTNFTIASDYAQQYSTAYEAGIKARFMEGAVRANLAVYRYDLRNLQVSVTLPTGPLTNGSFTINAGRARSQGVELDLQVRPRGIPGLSLFGAIAYNKARYLEFPVTCYRGESQAQGCLPKASAPGSFEQVLRDVQIVRSPDWGAAFGGDYETPLAATGLKIGVSADANYSDGYFNNAVSAPNMHQGSYWLLGGSIRIGAADDGWQVALIGNNLTNQLYVLRTSEAPGSGAAPGGLTPGTLGDYAGTASRGREIMLRITLRPTRL